MQIYGASHPTVFWMNLWKNLIVDMCASMCIRSFTVW